MAQEDRGHVLIWKICTDKEKAGAMNQERTSGGNSPITPPALHSLNPKAMWHTAELMWEVMRGESSLTTAQREMIATVTSTTLNCRF